MLFYQIVKKNEWDPQRPGWCTLGGSKIYHRKRGVSKQYFCMFLGSSTVVLSHNLHFIGFQGHTDSFKVIREKTIKVSFGFHCNHLFSERSAHWFRPVLLVTPGHWPRPRVMSSLSNGLGSNMQKTPFENSLRFSCTPEMSEYMSSKKDDNSAQIPLGSM